MKTKGMLRKPLIVGLLAIFCTILWGSAAPAIKTGYTLMKIESSDVSSIILFAGCRFAIAGFLVLLYDSVKCRQLPIMNRDEWSKCLKLGATQTIGQYVFNFIGVAHASSVNASILNGSGTLFSILFACIVFGRERMTVKKALGCVLGFGGLAVMNIGGATAGVSFMGEGFMLIGAVCNGIASNQCAKYARTMNPVRLTGAQFLVGGLIMCLMGLLTGGHFCATAVSAWFILIYLGALSAVAYTLWNVLLSQNDVTKVSVYGFLTPLSGVVISAFLMGEFERAVSARTLLSLLLVCVGVAAVSTDKPKNR